jgi:hypothetical protein
MPLQKKLARLLQMVINIGIRLKYLKGTVNPACGTNVGRVKQLGAH